jgi:hypothetical protein
MLFSRIDQRSSLFLAGQAFLRGFCRGVDAEESLTAEWQD